MPSGPFPVKRRHHNLVSATQPPITGPIEKGKGRGNSSGRGHGKPKGPTAPAIDNELFYNTVFQVDANGQANGTTYATEEGFMGNAFTYVGNAAVASNVFAFDGTGDYLNCSVGTNLVWVMGSSFSIELRDVKFTAATTAVLISSYNALAGERCWMLRWSSVTGTLGFIGSSNGTDDVEYAGYTWTPLTDGTSYNITCTWDGADVRLYIDGAYVAKTACTIQFNLIGHALRIGCNFSSGAAANFFNGTIRAVRLTKGHARTISETSITLPTLPFPTSGTPVDANYPNVVLLLGYDGTMNRIRDFGPYDWRPTLFGSVAGDEVNTLADGTPSITHNGTTDYSTLPDDPLFELGSGDFTLEVFARHTTVDATGQSYITKWNTPSNRSWLFDWLGSNTPDIARLARSSNGTGAAASVNGAEFTPTVNQFYHVSVCRNGSNHRLFVDGTQSGTTETTAVTLFDGSSVVRVGAVYSSSVTNFMKGQLAEIRVTKAARYTGNFTAPTGVLPHG